MTAKQLQQHKAIHYPFWGKGVDLVFTNRTLYQMLWEKEAKQIQENL